MIGTSLQRSLLATLAVGVGLIAYNGHAGLGGSAYQHNQTDLEFVAAAGVSDGTSNTIMFGERAAAGGRSGARTS